MEITKALYKELKQTPAGTYAPFLFRHRGIIADLSAGTTEQRANGIYSLFSSPDPVILKNELIAGNRMCLYSTEDKDRIEHAKSIVNRLGARSFGSNSDHFAPNYRRILADGIPGTFDAIDASIAAHGGDERRLLTLRAMRKTLEGFAAMIAKYAQAARRLIGSEGYDDERLTFIAGNCEALTERAPETFAEALQLVWFCHNAFVTEGRYAMALGRLDQYLYPYYKRDIERGAITDERVVELLENVFIRLEGDVVNIAVGGTSPDGKCEVNELSYLVVEAVKDCHIPGPNLSARIMRDTPDEFLAACLRSIGTGLGYPALMNDEVMIPGLESYGYPHEDVCNYSMVGCIENFMTGKQPPWSDNRFDTPRFIEYVFHNGISETGHTAGLDLGDVDEIGSMDEFMARLERELELGVFEYALYVNGYNKNLDPDYYEEPFLSIFCDDCIGRGLDINRGGAIYPSTHGAACMGVGTVADSLAAVEKVVFVDHEATLGEIRDAMKANFVGYDELRAKLLAAPKYGNNDDFVDKYAVWCLDYLQGLFLKQKTRDGGPFFVLMAANTQNISSGKCTGATPDGRLATEPISDAASPTYGRDVKGPTVTLASLSKPDYTKSAGGTVVNQKFSPAAFAEDKIGNLAALIKVYFKRGGQEVQINATSREILEDAMKHPENYGDLVVRVSGFSAYYVGLGRDVQLDILNRTSQG